ncbi:MAG: TonB-dependent receptor [Proteobacteria bacterium]|nr:TonB-dependent receptor [Pseudomonadota bacterium]
MRISIDSPPARDRWWLLAPLALCAVAALADPAPAGDLDEIVVSATRRAEPSQRLPASIDRLSAAQLREGQLGVNLSETLAAVPGISVQNRQNYAQDLQLSVRGFGARSSFGVRGVRLYADGIPGTMPDGQGQFSHFDLGSAEHIEVLRGPFSALYGNSSGGVISIYTEDPGSAPLLTASAVAGSLGTDRLALKFADAFAGGGILVDVAHFDTDGFRDHSRAERDTANAKLRLELGAGTTLTVIGNAIETPFVQDPLGLTRAQMQADPHQAGSNALAYNTRKSLAQQQVGATLTTAVSPGNDLVATVYAGHRATTQFQAILASVEANPLHPGGVIDLGREYRGGDAHWIARFEPGGTPLTVTVGASVDGLDEDRHGYLNFVGSELGVIGALRRDERNRVLATDEYLQAEWDPTARWRVIAGLRHNDISIDSRDETGARSPSELQYADTDPVVGVTFALTPAVHAYASYGRGFETPTLNDLAYRSTDGSLPGLNLGLKAATSDNYELGLKVAHGRWRANAAAFYIATHNELAVQASSGGRQVFENIDRSERRGGELEWSADWAAGFESRLAFTSIRAVTAAPYRSCAGTPCTPVLIPSGNRLPAVPANAVYAALGWRAPGVGFRATAETVGRSRIYVDDRNIDSAAGYWSTNLRAGFEQARASWKLAETLRVDNVTDRRYAGTIIVNESNGRYFEPDPGRTYYLLLTASFR